ncbi:MAG: hypothetical protein IPM58_11155 [Nitrospira sp.]|nr:hypothetical protein [Nitrospira sp.]
MSDIGLYPPTEHSPDIVTRQAIQLAGIDPNSGKCELVCQGGGTKAMIYLLLTLLLFPAVAQAEEKVVAVPRDQFVKVLAEVKQNKQLLSESGKLLAEYKEMFEKQKAYVETLEGLNENRKQESELLQEQNAALQEQLDAERRRKEDLAWNEKAQWAGLGAAVPTAIVILRKLVFKF